MLWFLQRPRPPTWKLKPPKPPASEPRFSGDYTAPEYEGHGEEGHDKAPFGYWTTHSPRIGMNDNLCKDVKPQIEENVPMSFFFCI